jgi:hypothetical protein
MAWLADSTAACVPATTFFQNPGPYVLPDMTKVADDWADLIDASLDSPINVTELGAIPIAGTSDVWTNVRTDGLPNGINPPLHTCSEWTSASEANSGKVGFSVFCSPLLAVFAGADPMGAVEDLDEPLALLRHSVRNEAERIAVALFQLLAFIQYPSAEGKPLENSKVECPPDYFRVQSLH